MIHILPTNPPQNQILYTKKNPIDWRMRWTFLSTVNSTRTEDYPPAFIINLLKRATERVLPNNTKKGTLFPITVKYCTQYYIRKIITHKASTCGGTAIYVADAGPAKLSTKKAVVLDPFYCGDGYDQCPFLRCLPSTCHLTLPLSAICTKPTWVVLRWIRFGGAVTGMGGRGSQPIRSMTPVRLLMWLDWVETSWDLCHVSGDESRWCKGGCWRCLAWRAQLVHSQWREAWGLRARAAMGC